MARLLFTQHVIWLYSCVTGKKKLQEPEHKISCSAALSSVILVSSNTAFLVSYHHCKNCGNRYDQSSPYWPDCYGRWGPLGGAVPG